MIAKISLLEQIAYNLRVDCLRATTQAGSGHLTSCLSAAEIVAVLFFHTMRYNPCAIFNPENDSFILSKGHAAPLLYAVYKELGLISEEELMTLRQIGSPLEGHPAPRFPFVDVATGSLGMGLSYGLGKILAARLDKYNPYVYVLMGDSETTEGSVWEAAEIAAYYKCYNLVGIIDVNRLGQSTATIEGHNVEKYRKKFEAFGWNAWLVDGHDSKSLIEVFDKVRLTSDKPSVIIAKTYKGYGLDAAIEDHLNFHGKAFSTKKLPQLLDNLRKKFPQAATAQEEHKKINCPPIITYQQKSIERTSLVAPYKKGEKIATRKSYGESLTVWGKEYPEIVSLDAEVKNSTFAEIFEKSFPERFFQCFIAEQNMVSMGVGFTTKGKIPFISTFSCFLTRAFDQLRMAAISKAPLRVVGSHAGVSVGEDGPSQMGLEDIAMMRTLPESIVLQPCDAVSTFYLIKHMIEYTQGISYLRTIREETPVIYDTSHQFEIGGCTVLKESDRDVACIIATGITVFEALKAAEELEQEGILVSVIDCYSIKPLPLEKIVTLIEKSNKRAVIVEDHYEAGGLGEALGSALGGKIMSVVKMFVARSSGSGDGRELRNLARIDVAGIKEILNHIARSF